MMGCILLKEKQMTLAIRNTTNLDYVCGHIVSMKLMVILLQGLAIGAFFKKRIY